MYIDADAESVVEPYDEPYWALLFAAEAMVVIMDAGTIETEPATIWAAAAPARDRATKTVFMTADYGSW